MFTLRSFQENLESNVVIGDSYQVLRREINYKKFCEAFKAVFLRDHIVDTEETADRFTKDCVAIIVYENGSKFIPIYKGVTYYVMTGEGSTYCNISYK